jgi:hypothetical protein
MERIWTCTFVGEADVMPEGADGPMRQAVARAFRKMTGNAPKAIFSWWGGTLGERERAVVENRDHAPPASEAVKEDAFRQAALSRQERAISQSINDQEPLVADVDPRVE